MAVYTYISSYMGYGRAFYLMRDPKAENKKIRNLSPLYPWIWNFCNILNAMWCGRKDQIKNGVEISLFAKSEKRGEKWEKHFDILKAFQKRYN